MGCGGAQKHGAARRGAAPLGGAGRGRYKDGRDWGTALAAGRGKAGRAGRGGARRGGRLVRAGRNGAVRGEAGPGGVAVWVDAGRGGSLEQGDISTASDEAPPLQVSGPTSNTQYTPRSRCSYHIFPTHIHSNALQDTQGSSVNNALGVTHLFKHNARCC